MTDGVKRNLSLLRGPSVRIVSDCEDYLTVQENRTLKDSLRFFPGSLHYSLNKLMTLAIQPEELYTYRDI